MQQERRVKPGPDAKALAKMELFIGVPPETLAGLSSAARIEYVAKGHVIFEQGGHADRAYAVGEGSVRIVQTGSDGAQVLIRFIASGEMFATVPIFTNHKFPADAIAAERSLILSWSEADLLKMIEARPQAAMNVIRILGARLAEVQDRLREIATQSVERRVANALLRLAAQAGQSTAEGTEIAIPIRRKDLAEISGTTLHTASRVLAAWEKSGLLLSGKQRLTIHRLSAIRRIAGG